MRGQQHSPDAGAVRPQHLLLDAADRQHLASQRDLARHRDVVARRARGEDRRHRGEHGHPGRRPFLGLGARGNMDVDVVLFEQRWIDAQLTRAILEIRQSG